MAIERLERGRLLVRGALVPTPREQTHPCARQGPHGGLRGFPRVALRLGRDPGPAGMPERCRRPRPTRVAAAGRAREAPVDPRCFAAALRHGCDPGRLWACCGGSRACAWLAPGHQEAGSAARSGPWQGLAAGQVGRVLGARGAGGVQVLEGVPGDTERADEGLDEQGLGGDAARRGGPGPGGLASVETRVEDGRRAPRVVAKAGVQGGARVVRLCGWASDGARPTRCGWLSPATRAAPAGKSAARSWGDEG